MLEKEDNVICDIDQLELAKKIILAEPMDLGADILEIGLDQILEEGIIKDIPVFGSFIKIGKTIKSIHDAIFAKKVLVFAQNIHSGNDSEDKWERHKEKLKNNPKRLMKELEVLLIYIDRHTKYIKNKILGKFYSLYYMGEIDWGDFEELAEILDVISVFDFETLEELYIKKYYAVNENYNPLALKRLSNCGLADFFNGMVVTDNSGEQAANYIAKITDLGEYFWEFGLNGIDIKSSI